MFQGEQCDPLEVSLDPGRIVYSVVSLNQLPLCFNTTLQHLLEQEHSISNSNGLCWSAPKPLGSCVDLAPTCSFFHSFFPNPNFILYIFQSSTSQDNSPYQYFPAGCLYQQVLGRVYPQLYLDGPVLPQLGDGGCQQATSHVFLCMLNHVVDINVKPSVLCGYMTSSN